MNPLIAAFFFFSTLAGPAQDSSSGYRILIQKSKFSLFLYKGDEVAKQYSICIGKNPGNKQARNDMRTPEGTFVVSQIQNSRQWVHDFRDGKGPIAGAYGPWFLRLKAVSGTDWKGIGIHGTHNPASIGTMASEGCMRLKNEELEELKSLVRVGTPVQIMP